MDMRTPSMSATIPEHGIISIWSVRKSGPSKRLSFKLPTSSWRKPKTKMMKYTSNMEYFPNLSSQNRHFSRLSSLIVNGNPKARSSKHSSFTYGHTTDRAVMSPASKYESSSMSLCIKSTTLNFVHAVCFASTPTSLMITFASAPTCKCAYRNRTTFISTATTNIPMLRFMVGRVLAPVHGACCLALPLTTCRLERHRGFRLKQMTRNPKPARAETHIMGMNHPAMKI
mmetsp:Transcript_7395/g.13469  ORF Transcript_7395/g.13469 Transcript_7395/m.13469 type:complete len:228 (-) Transcript_7395:2684-3367(-)